MDQIDEKILSLLAENARMPLKKIAEQVFLSPPAVATRIERLERRGVILGYRAVVSPEKLGRRVMAFVHVVIQPEHQSAFASFARKTPEVAACYHVTGPYSMLLQVCCADTAQLDALVTQIQKFGTTQTQVVFSTLKDGWNGPTGEPGQ